MLFYGIHNEKDGIIWPHLSFTFVNIPIYLKPINCWTIKKKFFLQGEKAYSCSQCGTRFTYRNGLIKHTKLNRCPKKIITPEGETIIKKRSRSFGTASSKAKQGQDQVGSKTNENQGNVTNAASLAGLRSPTSTVPQHFAQSPTAASAASASAMSNDNLSALLETSEANVANESQGGNNAAATLFVQDQQIQLHANGDTYGLAVLEDGSLVATPQHKTAPPLTSTLSALSASAIIGGAPAQKSRSPATAATTTHTNLSPSVIAALSAATGLPANEIYSWAANLPAGSTVKVTHHFESPPSSQPSSLPATAGNPALNAAAHGKTALTSIRQTSPTVTTSRLQLQADRLLMDHVLRQQRQQLTLEMANTCHDSLISACVGLPSYQESFAVDPNEILSRERGTKNLMVPPVVIKEEPLTPNMFTNEDELNNNNMEDDSLSTMISSCGGDFGSHFNNYIQNQHRSAYPLSDDNISLNCRPQLPSHINVANSRLLTNHAMSSSLASDPHHMFTSSSSSEHSFLPSPTSSMSSSSPTCNTNTNRGAVQNHSQLTSTTSDFDLDEIPVNFLDDMDICAGFNLNDQDFTTMKSIVEQTFKDGRDVLDIISAV